jgi:hypothetical protein
VAKKLAYDGYAVFKWPEYQAFRKRLGIPDDTHERGVTIRVYEGEAVLVTLEFLGADKSPVTGTTDAETGEFTTAEPTAIVGGLRG